MYYDELGLTLPYTSNYDFIILVGIGNLNFDFINK